jgi:hypothetical protein
LETPKTNAGMLTEKFMMNNFWENSPNQICNLTTQQYNKLYQQIHSLIRRRNLIEFLNEKEEDESVPAETVVGQVSVSSANGETAGLTDEQIKLIKWFMRLAIELQECDYTTESVMSIDVEAWMNDYYENGLTSFQAIMEDESNA